MTSQGFDFYAVTQKLLEKEPRLLIAISDCCNNIIPEGFMPEIFQNRFYDWWGSNVNKNYKKLFLESEGVFIGTGCLKGEYSYCNSVLGGFFTNAFCASLESVAYEKEYPEWEGVISEIGEKVQKMSSDEQHPFCFFISERPTKDLDLMNYLY